MPTITSHDLRSVLSGALEGALDDRPRTHRPPAAVLGVSDSAGSALAAVGTADLVAAEPATSDHAQDIASVSKVLTTLATLVLVSRGHLRLDDTVGHVIGDRGDVHASARIEDLLRHRSGMAPWVPLYLMPEPADPIDRALAVGPRTRPGTERLYSDLGMIVLGHLLETATGQSLPALVRELLLDPLGAHSVTPGGPRSDSPALTGGEGDAIEQEMVRTGVPYATGVTGLDFAWRTAPVRREIGDGNAHHAFGGATGHAGWFSAADGLLAIASALADPHLIGIDKPTAAALGRQLDDGQGLGVRCYRIPWRGRTRTFLGHPGFTGAFVAAAPATDADGPVRVALLANRLHGAPTTDAGRLLGAEQLWRAVMTRLDETLHPRGGTR